MSFGFDPNTSLLAGVSRDTLQLWLTQAQTALMQINMGQKVVTVGYDGKNVSYTKTDLAKLENWIVQLQRQLGMRITRRALRPYFR